jgi:hypothetical protein
VFVGVTKHRVVIEWSSPASPAPKTTRISLPSDGKGWDETLARVIDRFFPEPITIDAGSDPTAVSEPSLLGLQVDTFWGPAMIVAGGAVLIVASILAERSAHAQRQLFDGASTPSEYESIHGRWHDFAIASVTLFGVGAVITGGGIVLSFWL